MTFKKAGIILFLIFSFLFSLLPIQRIFAQSSNTGFVSANIWYSKDPFQEGDKIKIYTLVFNPDSRELSGTVFFFDNTTLLGKNDFTVSANATKAISISWTATAGDHSIYGKIENAKFLVSKGNYEEVYLSNNETTKSSRTVSSKITSNTANTNSTSPSNNDISSTVSNLENTITDKTPSFITKPIISTTNNLESFRQDANIASEKKEGEIKNQIDVLNNTKTAAKDNTASNPLLKPFKYVELFLLSLSSFVLDNKIVFYAILIIFVFFILRFIWKKIF